MKPPFVIKNEEQYEEALAHVATLMDAPPGSAREAELEVWGTLVELYEKDAHPIPLPDPIEAIKFRMEQAGLSRKDLVPFLGSPSKVSEVLSGKRSLSLEMMRRLHEGLGIPAAVLLCKPGAQLPDVAAEIEWKRFPIQEMRQRGWIHFVGTARAACERAEELMRAFITPFEEDAELPMCARQHVRDGRKMDPYALCAWKIRVMHLAAKCETNEYVPGTVTQDFIRDVVRLSYLADGPKLAQEYLAKNGIALVVERHLPQTYLDGAALMLPEGKPVIALTLRYDRLDHFWFTLAHELAHVALHLDGDLKVFFDDLEAGDASQWETDADRLAAEALIPRVAWQAAHLGPRSSPGEVVALARDLKISSAIPAGRIRHEAGNHRLFWHLVGNRTVRALFAAPPR